MSTSIEEFARTYIAAWSTDDPVERHRLIDTVYAEEAEFFADEPGDSSVECHGRAEIYQNITQVNERLTQGAGLVTTGTGASENHDLLRVSWQMSTSNGDIAAEGDGTCSLATGL